MNLSIQILVALILSVCAGLVIGPEGLPFVNKWIAPIGTIFINFIKMMIVPVVTCSLIVGVTSLGGDSKKLGRISAKTICLYLVTTAGYHSDSDCSRFCRGRHHPTRRRPGYCRKGCAEG